MNRNRIIIVLCLVLTAALLAAGGLLGQSISREYNELQLGLRPTVDTHRAPPAVTLASTVGGPVRAAAVMYLWDRATRLKDAGQYAEANQWSQWISMLQPGFQQVWVFNAWNMAYNISVETHTPQDRWFWVNSGISLLRDHGIPLNPRGGALYRELAWIFLHKIEQYSDDMHWYYKRRLALEWHEVVGAPEPGETTEQALARFGRIVDAPDDIAALRRQVPQVAPLLEELATLTYRPDERMLRHLARARMVLDSVLMHVFAGDAQQMRQRFDMERLPALDDPLVLLVQRYREADDPRKKAALEALENHLRKRIITDRYNMDVNLMYQLMAGDQDDPDLLGFGPLDWRHPASHGLYWIVKGIIAVRDVDRLPREDALNIYRSAIHAMQSLARNGTISFDPTLRAPEEWAGEAITIDMTEQQRPVIADVDPMLAEAWLIRGPDLRFYEGYDRIWQRAIDVITREEVRGTPQAYEPGHENMLLDAIMAYFAAGEWGEARRYFERARDLYGDMEHNRRTGRYEQSLEQLATNELIENLDTQDHAQGFIQVQLVRGFRDGLLQGDLGQYRRYREFAAWAHERWHEGRRGDIAAPLARQHLPPLPEMERAAFAMFMLGADPFYGFAPLRERRRAWEHAPLELREAVYPRIIERLRHECRQAGIDPDLAFPDPRAE